MNDQLLKFIRINTWTMIFDLNNLLHIHIVANRQIAQKTLMLQAILQATAHGIHRRLLNMKRLSFKTGCLLKPHADESFSRRD